MSVSSYLTKLKLKYFPYKDDYKNLYCGVHRLTTGPFDPFVKACETHDEAYMMNEAGTNKASRKCVDKEFLRSMLVTAHRYKGRAKAILVAKAYTYYGLVRLFGGIVW